MRINFIECAHGLAQSIEKATVGVDSREILDRLGIDIRRTSTTSIMSNAKALAALVSDPDEEVLDDVLGMMPDHVATMGSPIDAALLAERGIRILPLFVLAATIGEIDFEANGCKIDVEIWRDRLQIQTHLRPRDAQGVVTWSGALHLAIVPEMPATMAAAIADRPLRDLVSHPVLDRYDLRIARVDARSGMALVHVAGEPAMERLIPKDIA